ncbi:hypothetical protein DRN97_09510 [Methanosarcinales archaeon]|nr:MAG: hypothetical protein DRN97_09510 [Methanosarcinales archaeon]
MRKKRVAEHYNKISRYYDGFGFGFLKLKRLFEFRILDVACGTGNMSFELATKFKRVYGIDISRGMLNRAKLKLKTARTCKSQGRGCPGIQSSRTPRRLFKEDTQKEIAIASNGVFYRFRF